MIGVSAILSRIPLAAWTAAGAVALMAVPLGVQTVRLGSATSRIETLDRRIEDIASRLAVCRANTATLTQSLTDQNDAIEAIRSESAARIAQAEADAEAAREQIADALARAERTLTRPIAGNTVCERVQDVHSAFMAELEGEAQ